MARKKIIDSSPDEVEPVAAVAPEPVAKQTHVVTTRYTKTIPIAEVETPGEVEEYDEDYVDDIPDDEIIELHDSPIRLPRPAPTIEPPPGAGDTIAQMLADLQIDKKQHSWTMVVERLPNYDRDNRHDVGARRVNCGTRQMTENFIEEIRAEFARPGRQNHFRVTIKRDGRIFAHWPEVISLEPPPVEELPELDARFSPAPPAAAAADPAKPAGLDDLVRQLKQLNQIRTLLVPETVQNPTPPAATEEAALLTLLASSPDVVERVTSKISRRLFREQEQEAGEWVPLVRSLLDNGPAIVQQIFAGVAQLRQGPAVAGPAPAPAPAPEPLPPPVSPQQPTPPVESGPAPEVVLLGNVIRYLEISAPVQAAAAFVDSFVEQNPTMDPLVESFLAMSPQECQTFMASFFPQASNIVNAPHAVDWISGLQRQLRGEEADK